MRKTLFQFALIILISASIVSCKKDEELTGPESIYALALANPDLSTLATALEKTGLDDDLNGSSGAFTVFAPTNAAFSNFLSANGFANLDAVPVDVLTSVLLNHVVNGSKKAADLSTGYLKTLATYNSNNLSLYVNIGLPTVVTFAASNPEFSILVEALTRPDLSVNYATVLSGAGPFTVFAPTNAAFTSLLTELGATSLNDIDAQTLEQVLTYHVVSGNVVASSLTEGQTVTTLQSGTFTISLAGGAKITDFNNRVSNIIATDVQGSNGVVHVIDKVILPQL